VAIVLAAFLLLLFYYFNPYLYALLTIVFDALLLVLILDSIKGEEFSTNKVLEWAGKNSMAIYLWHQIPLLILASVVGRNKPMLFYSLTFVSEIALLYAIFLLSKISFIRIYFFGVR
jgi:peptidoglycan/LPS O-acetylase OafA/YrhL